MKNNEYRLLPVALAPHIKDALTRWTDFQASAWADVMQAQANIDAAAPERSGKGADEWVSGTEHDARMDVRNAALEEAAAICDMMGRTSPRAQYCTASAWLASRIRDRKSAPAGNSSAAPSDDRCENCGLHCKPDACIYGGHLAAPAPTGESLSVPEGAREAMTVAHAEQVQSARVALSELFLAAESFLSIYDQGEAPDSEQESSLRDKVDAAGDWLISDSSRCPERNRILAAKESA